MILSNRAVPIGILVLSMLVGGSIAASSQRSPAIQSIDAPGAGTGPGQGTLAIVVNSAGTVMGQYIDANNAYHGFVRSRHGVFSTFDVPQAGIGAGQGTVPESMNERGEITGYYVDSAGSAHGFARYPDGYIVSFDVPGVGMGGCIAPIICASGTQG
jgi:hypothetical protein